MPFGNFLLFPTTKGFIVFLPNLSSVPFVRSIRSGERSAVRMRAFIAPTRQWSDSWNKTEIVRAEKRRIHETPRLSILRTFPLAFTRQEDMETVGRGTGARVGCCLWKTLLILVLWKGKTCYWKYVQTLCFCNYFVLVTNFGFNYVLSPLEGRKSHNC